jgi:putative flippase GtrA
LLQEPHRILRKAKGVADDARFGTDGPEIAIRTTQPIPQVDLTVGVRRLAGSPLASLIARVRPNLPRLTRYGVTSLVCLGVSEATLLVLYAFGVNASLAALAANLTGILPSYLLSRYWIWPEADRRRVGRQVVFYWGISIAAMLVTSVATGVVASRAPVGALHLPFVGVGYLLISVVLWVAKFILYQRVIFTPARGSAG